MPAEGRPDIRKPIFGRKALDSLREMLESVLNEQEEMWERSNYVMPDEEFLDKKRSPLVRAALTHYSQRLSEYLNRVQDLAIEFGMKWEDYVQPTVPNEPNLVQSTLSKIAVLDRARKKGARSFSQAYIEGDGLALVASALELYGHELAKKLKAMENDPYELPECTQIVRDALEVVSQEAAAWAKYGRTAGFSLLN